MRRQRSTSFADDYVSYTLKFFDQAIRAELAALGMPPGRKAYDLSPPAGVGLVVREYLRGVLDGDGSLGFTRTGMPFVSLVTASEQLAQFFERQIWEVRGVRRSTRRNSRDRVFNVMVSNKAAALLAAHCWATQDWPRCLERLRPRPMSRHGYLSQGAPAAMTWSGNHGRRPRTPSCSLSPSQSPPRCWVGP